jgi:hypothetical protein
LDWQSDLLHTDNHNPQLQVTIALSLIHTLFSSLLHILSLLSLLCLHQSLPCDGSEQCLLLSCSRSYRLATVPQLTHRQSQRQTYFTTGGLPPINSSWGQAPLGSRPEIFSIEFLLHSPHVTSSLTRDFSCPAHNISARTAQKTQFFCYFTIFA